VRRRIGYLNIELEGKLNIQPHEYDRFQTPKMFSDLSPTTNLFDSDEQPINPLEMQID
jgi:hypothetical protein